jgi:hypothetical protein|tara:strand:+ start:291 stop:605 length:315 start_codon:yes stop_codon:yes gene_type:complete
MSSDRVSIEIPISIENDLEVDNDGHFFVLTFIFPADDEDSVECRVLFDDIVESLIGFHADEPGSDGYGQLYLIANELARQAERLREVAGRIEDSEVSDDLFGDI